MQRKIDWRVIPQLIFIYMLSYIDRGNVGNARLFGAQQDTGLSNTEWNIGLSLLCRSPCRQWLTVSHHLWVRWSAFKHSRQEVWTQKSTPCTLDLRRGDPNWSGSLSQSRSMVRSPTL